MIKLVDVLAAIDAYQTENRISDTELSRLATGSTDTIRNWRRAVSEGRDAGAQTKKLQAVGRIIGVDFALDGALPLLRSEAEIRSMLERIVGLTENDVEFIAKQIKAAQISNAGGSPHSPDRDRSPSASRPRVTTP